MAISQVSAEIMAPPDAVYEIVSDPALLQDWDVTYGPASPVPPDREGEPTFTVQRTFANRTMRFVCHVDSALPDTRFSFSCTGDEGELLQEVFDLAPAQNGAATRFTRRLTYELPGKDLGVADETIFAEAMGDRSVEQAFARLNATFTTQPAHPLPAPGDTGRARTGSGPTAPAA